MTWRDRYGAWRSARRAQRTEHLVNLVLPLVMDELRHHEDAVRAGRAVPEGG